MRMFWTAVKGAVVVVVTQIPWLIWPDGLIAAPTPDTALDHREFVSCSRLFVVVVVATLRCGAAPVPDTPITVGGGFTTTGEGAGARRFVRHAARQS